MFMAVVKVRVMRVRVTDGFVDVRVTVRFAGRVVRAVGVPVVVVVDVGVIV